MTAQCLEWLLDGPEWLTGAVREQLLNQEHTLGQSAIAEGIEVLARVIKGAERGFDALIEGRTSYTQELYWYLFLLLLLNLSLLLQLKLF